MKIKKLMLASLTSLVGAASLFTLSSCIDKPANKTTDITNENVDKKYQIYVLAKDSGYTGTYEEWLNEIKGDSVELKVENATILWRYTKDKDWIELINLSDLFDEKAKVEFSTNADKLVWKYKNETEWKDLFDLSSLKGNDGKSAYEIAKEAGFTGTADEWLESLKAEAAKNIELSANATHILWKYENETEWKNLIELSLLEGAAGKSAYEIAVEQGFEGEVTEWLDSLKGNGISDVEILEEDEASITYSINFTNGDSFVFDIPKAKAPEEIDERTKGVVFAEIAGYGYQAVDFYGESDDILVPSTYNGKPVLSAKINFQSYSVPGDKKAVNELVISENITDVLVIGDINALLLPHSAKSVYLSGTVDSLFYNGTFEELIDLNLNVNISNLFLLDENGDIEYNGQKYKQIDLTVMDLRGYETITKDLVSKLSRFKPSSICMDSTTTTIKKDAFIDFNTTNSVLFYDGTLSDWSNITFESELSNPMSRIEEFYIPDENGDATYDNKRYSYLNDLYIDENVIGDYQFYGFDVAYLTLSDTVEKIGKSAFGNFEADEVLYDGVISDWLKIDFYNEESNPGKNSSIFVIDQDGSYTHDNKNYNSPTEIVLDEYYEDIEKKLIGFDCNILVINSGLEKYYQNHLLFLSNYDIYYDGNEDIDFSQFTYANMLNLYIKTDVVTEINYNGNYYYKFTLEQQSDAPINKQMVWNPLSLAEAQKSYNVSGSIDANVVYNRNYGITYNGALKNASTVNPIDGLTYAVGDTLPAWKEFATKLGLASINQAGLYGSNDASSYNMVRENNFIGINGEQTDIFSNTTANLKALAADKKLVDLLPYLNSGKMPAFNRFLNNNPEIASEILVNGGIYYLPYFDGYQNFEKSFILDTAIVEKLLDEDLPEGTGNLLAGASADINSKGLKGSPVAEPYIDGNYNYPSATQISIVNPNTKTAVKVNVAQTSNIIKDQNALLAVTDGSTTGKDLIDQFKNYARAAYGDIIDNYYDGKISKMFTSVGACYNADDLVALLRIFKANPDVLYGSADAYDEVVPVFPRGGADNRVYNILQFGATLYGVQGFDSELDNLYIGADGKMHDAQTTKASYDLLDKLNGLYSEGLIEEGFWVYRTGTIGVDTYFKKTANNPTFGLLEYDYIATQTVSNDLYKGIGTDPSKRKTAACGFDFSNMEIKGIAPVLSPLTYVSTNSSDINQDLDDTEGKTIQRYYESNRTIKGTSWAIPYNSDNIDSAIALMDLMFTKEGWEIQNFGPSDYWDYQNILGVETPVIKDIIFEHALASNIDIWTYFYGFMGTALGIAHYRPITLDLQTASRYSQEAYINLVLACNLNVQINSRFVASALSPMAWNSAIPLELTRMDADTYKSYGALDEYWNSHGKAARDGNPTGWVKSIVGASDTDEVIYYNGSYTLSGVKALQTTKNLTYLKFMSSQLDLIPEEAEE